MVIAIDGPSAAGKSTVARALARHFRWRYLDTGALYRALALAALERGVASTDTGGLARLSREASIEVVGERVCLDGRDVRDRVRDEDVAGVASAISAHPEVREALISIQRDVAEEGKVVMEGRDIGTVVAPNAAVKVFLTASGRERARRRCEQLGRACDAHDLQDIERSLARRDRADATRSNSPLVRAPDAVEIDSTDKTVDEVVDEIVRLAKHRRDEG